MSSFVGKVIQVDYNYVQIEVDSQINSMNVLHKGTIRKIGHVGNFLQINVGLYKVIGIVENTQVVEFQPLNGDLLTEKKIITINIIGSINEDLKFKPGLAILPNISDSVEVMNLAYFESIYGTTTKYPIYLGDSYYNDNLKVSVDLNNFVLNHSGFFGSTGSGKSNMVASTLLNLASDYPSSRAVVIDVHGEYGKYLGDKSIEFTASKRNNTEKLVIPYWLLKFSDLAKLLNLQEDGAFGPSQTFEEVARLITEQKKAIAGVYNINIRDVNRDTPIPFNIRQLWFKLHKYGYSTFAGSVSQRDDFSEIGIQYEADGGGKEMTGDADELIKPRFKNLVHGSIVKSNFSEYQTIADNLFRILKDERLEFMFGKNPYSDGTKDIDELIELWIENDKNITILNFEGAPLSILDLAISSLINIIFDIVISANKLRSLNNEIDYEARPLIFCFEEAHVYLMKGHRNKSTVSTERIMKEGRKYGIGAMIISQRPSDISSTILSQVGTLVALQLTNSDDIGIVRTYATNNSKYIINAISSLDVGESVIIGKSIKVPARIYTEELESVKKIKFIDRVAEWKNEKNKMTKYSEIIKEWRKGY